MKTIRFIFCILLLLFQLSACAQSAQPVRSVEYAVAFSPCGQSLEIVLSAINSARESIHVAAYSFTSKPIAEALLAVYKRGLDVRVVVDKKDNSNEYSAVTFLANHGVPVRLNGEYAIHHHKFMVIDYRHIQTGSLNYSAAAMDKNAENVLVLWDMPELAAQYEYEWNRLWKEGEKLEAKY